MKFCHPQSVLSIFMVCLELGAVCNGSSSGQGHQSLLPQMIKSKSTTSIPSLSHIPRPGKATRRNPYPPPSPCLHEHLGSL